MHMVENSRNPNNTSVKNIMTVLYMNKSCTIKQKKLIFFFSFLIMYDDEKPLANCIFH